MVKPYETSVCHGELQTIDKEAPVDTLKLHACTSAGVTNTTENLSQASRCPYQRKHPVPNENGNPKQYL
jgi:hypothetical protein